MTLRKFSAPSQVWGNIPSQQTLCYQFPAEICLDCVHGTLHEDFGARANKNCSNQFKPAFPVTAISLGQRRSPCESWCLYYTLLCNSFLSSLPVFPSVPASWTWNVGNSQPKSMKINILPASWISNAEQIFCGTPSLGAPACSLQSAVCGLRSAVCSLQSANVIHRKTRSHNRNLTLVSLLQWGNEGVKQMKDVKENRMCKRKLSVCMLFGTCASKHMPGY